MSKLRLRCALAAVFFCAALAGCSGTTLSKAQLDAMSPMSQPIIEHAPNTEDYNHIVDNPFVSALEQPQSTFSTSVDTASYSNVRRFLNEGQLPPKDAVRIADILNYFDYDYPEPTGQHPVAIGLEMGACPWNDKHNLLKIAVKARIISTSQMPARNLVFLIDTSGSMSAENRLPLVKQSLELLVQQLTERDVVSIVTYAGDASLRLPPTPGHQLKKIQHAINGLVAGGSTNGGGGIVTAYEQAQASFIPGGVNRVILATDGDFNVGVSSDAELVRLIEEKRKTGVYLTVLGYGMGNLKDNKLELLAHHGNGHYAYIDSIDEAKKVFVDQGGALAVIAKDVKLQVEFNHTKVNAYRLIGYENRMMRNEEFRDDAKDAGDMGSGHTCTALYEIVPIGVDAPLHKSVDLKYQKAGSDTAAAKSGEWLTVRMRYKQPDSERGMELAVEVPANGVASRPSADFRFAAAAAAFGMLLRDSEYKGAANFEKVLAWAKGSLGSDRNELRTEFTALAEKARQLQGRERAKQ